MSNTGCYRGEIVVPRFYYLLKISLCFLVFAASSWVFAGSREQAKRIHDRIAGVPPSASTLDAMAAQIDLGNTLAAALIAVEDDAFYNVTLKNWITPWTNFDQTVFAPLNDYTATLIGVIRDDIDFRTAFYDDILYVGNTTGLPAYAINSNAHYETLEESGVSLKTALVQRTQSSLSGLPADATAGIITSRASAKAFFIDGTNRAMFRFTLLNHLCVDLEQVRDNTRTPDRIRQDVTRSPGGDSRVFTNNCLSCHAGMDPMAQAYAYYDFSRDIENDPEGNNGFISYNAAGTVDETTGTRVERKYLVNANNFQFGFQTPDDEWRNYWRAGPNANLGWDSSLTGTGFGAKTMTQELAHSEQFAQCQVEKVFKAMCLREPSNAADRTQVATLVDTFQQNSYQLKPIFAGAAAFCMGD
ncbi:MAG: hypothetical protein AAGB12_10125 [Pseudomonadota bacterium]